MFNSSQLKHNRSLPQSQNLAENGGATVFTAAVQDKYETRTSQRERTTKLLPDS